MKTIILLLLSLAFIFTANSAPAPVLNAHGKSLRAGVEYYALPAAGYGEYGGIILPDLGNKSCPPQVARSRGDENGLLLTFTPVNPKKDVIRLSTDVNIKLSAGSNSCHESNIWKLKYDKGKKQYEVVVGGVEGNPGPNTLNNWFKIEKSSYGGYKFVFCPSVCRYCKVMCKDVGLAEDGGLVLSDDHASFYFS